MRIGVLGGSFNPAHSGHAAIARRAREKLGLDQVWLMVSPGNPLKPVEGMAPMACRMASARRIADGRRIVATGIEAALGTRYTVDTLRTLRRRFPRAQFVWIMGADNLLQLPHWRRWLDVAGAMPIAVLPRPSYNHRALAGLAARRMRARRIPAGRASVLADYTAPAWVFLPISEDPTSATAIRAAAKPENRAQSRRSRAIARKPPIGPAHPDPPAARRKTPVRKPARPALPAADRTPGTARKKAAAAGPRAPSRRAEAEAERSRLDQLQGVIVQSLEDDKAGDVVSLDLEGKATFCDRMVIATGLADRQINAMATHLEEKLGEAGLKRVLIEGGGSDWVLIDAGDIIVHLFKPEARAMYGLEKMWGVDLDEAV